MEEEEEEDTNLAAHAVVHAQYKHKNQNELRSFLAWRTL